MAGAVSPLPSPHGAVTHKANHPLFNEFEIDYFLPPQVRDSHIQ